MSLIPFRTKRSTGMEPEKMASLAEFREEMNRVFEDFLSRGLPWSGWMDSLSPGRLLDRGRGAEGSMLEAGHWLPAVDLREDEGRIHVRVELPGVGPEDVDVRVSEDRLVIAGEKRSEEETAGPGWMHRESHCGSFTRSIPLPEPVDPDQVTARYDKGVLTVELVKSPAGTSRKVPVTAT